ncbi:hypothetical protein M9H77_17425 [Catharanthus roseus]|uniref:Uncharacterized protein n=1 Tax=Catharanthus roseus TaxID=4058 RepID=A0ACC0B4L3_CATRO|nr:hypothetical protein M9H77_17425 [Catharanthus roseus]
MSCATSLERIGATIIMSGVRDLKREKKAILEQSSRRNLLDILCIIINGDVKGNRLGTRNGYSATSCKRIQKNEVKNGGNYVTIDESFQKIRGNVDRSHDIYDHYKHSYGSKNIYYELNDIYSYRGYSCRRSSQTLGSTSRPLSYNNLKLLILHGTFGPYDYEAWEQKVESLFYSYGVREEVKCQSVLKSLSYEVNVWWDCTCENRRRMGAKPIKTWSLIKQVLRNIFGVENSEGQRQESEHLECSKEKESEFDKSERVKENECFIEKQESEKEDQREKEIVVFEKSEVDGCHFNITTYASCVLGVEDRGRSMEKELGTILEDLPISLSLNPSLMFYEVSFVKLKLFLESYLSHVSIIGDFCAISFGGGLFLVVPYVSKCLFSHNSIQDSLMHSGTKFDPSCYGFGILDDTPLVDHNIIGFELDCALFNILYDECLGKFIDDVDYAFHFLDAFMKNIDGLAKIVSERPPRTIPSNIEVNPREHVNAILVRMDFKNKNEGLKDEREPSKLLIIYTTSKDYSREEVQGGKDQNDEKKQKRSENEADGINEEDLPPEVPKYAKYLKEMLSSKSEIDKAFAYTLGEECSAILTNKKKIL